MKAQLKRKGKKYSLADRLRWYKFLYGKGGVVRLLLSDYLAFFSPKFHPWQQNNLKEVREVEAEIVEKYCEKEAC